MATQATPRRLHGDVIVTLGGGYYYMRAHELSRVWMASQERHRGSSCHRLESGMGSPVSWHGHLLQGKTGGIVADGRFLVADKYCIIGLTMPYDFLLEGLRLSLRTVVTVAPLYRFSRAHRQI